MIVGLAAKSGEFAFGLSWLDGAHCANGCGLDHRS
jgi:hypothetical protein